MKQLNWPTNKEQSDYMAKMKSINVDRAMNNPNENWMFSKLSEDWTRQASWGYRIFDFWNHNLGCAVEVDGPEHDRDYDNYRDEYNFRRSGIVVLRVRNNNESDATSVLDAISRLSDHASRKESMGIKGQSRKSRRVLSEASFDKDDLMFLDFLTSINHKPYWLK